MTFAEFLAELQRVLTYPFLRVSDTDVSLATLLYLFVAFAVAFWVSRLLGRVFERTVAEASLRYALRRLARYVLLALAALVSLQMVGFDLSSLALFGGLLGVGLGFGLQNLFSNFASGLLLLLERPIKVGDYVEVGGKEGWVQDIRLRVTVVNTRDNETYIVPNAELVSQTVRNWSYRDPTVRENIPIGVAYGSDLDKVKRVLLAAAAGHPDVLKDPPPDVLFVGHGDSSLDLKLRVWLAGPKRGPVVRSDLRFEIDRRFRAEGVTIPFPQRDVHLFPTPAAA